MSSSAVVHVNHPKKFFSWDPPRGGRHTLHRKIAISWKKADWPIPDSTTELQWIISAEHLPLYPHIKAIICQHIPFLKEHNHGLPQLASRAKLGSFESFSVCLSNNTSMSGWSRIYRAFERSTKATEPVALDEELQDNIQQLAGVLEATTIGRRSESN